MARSRRLRRFCVGHGGHAAHAPLPCAAARGDAAARGATLALVHAEQATSSPILQRLGFTVYGQQRVLVISPDAGG